MAEKQLTARVASVQLVKPINLFGAGIGTVSETMMDVTLVKVSDGVRVFKAGHDGYEDISWAGIASIRYRTEPRNDQ